MNRQETLEYLSANKILPEKKFGQNFLADDNIIDEIIRVSGIKTGSRVLEIGPGAGALTGKLIRHGAQVTAVEIDKRLAEVLKRDVPEADIIQADYLKLNDYSQSEYEFVISNIPYYVMTPILSKLITDLPRAKKMTFMIEEEAYRRIDASNGSKQYGPLSILCDLYGTVKREFTVGREYFYPIPNTTSMVFTLTKRSDNEVDLDKIFLEFIEKCFSQRRKKLINSCPEAKEALSSLGFDGNIRAEQISPADFYRLFAEKQRLML